MSASPVVPARRLSLVLTFASAAIVHLGMAVWVWTDTSARADTLPVPISIVMEASTPSPVPTPAPAISRPARSAATTTQPTQQAQHPLANPTSEQVLTEPATASVSPAPATTANTTASAETSVSERRTDVPVMTTARFDAAYLNNPSPMYPPVARRLGEQGRVVLRVQVSAEGLPVTVALGTSSGFPRLDQSALEAVTRWRFIPAKRGEQAIAAVVLVPIQFNLRDAS